MIMFIESKHRGFKPVFVIPHEKERENVEEEVRDNASIVFITTPGQVSIMIHLSFLVLKSKL